MKKTLLVFFFGYMSGTKTLSSFVGPTIVRKKSRLFSVFFGNYTGTTQSCGDYLINPWHCQDPVMKRPAVFLNGFRDFGPVRWHKVAWNPIGKMGVFFTYQIEGKMMVSSELQVPTVGEKNLGR